MADEEADPEIRGGRGRRAVDPPGLGERLLELEDSLRRSEELAEVAASEYCQRFCQTLLEYAEKFKAAEDHLPLLEVYTVAIQSYSKARPYLTSDCENVSVVLERLALSCVELLLGLPPDLPDKNWKTFQTAVHGAHQRLLENGNLELHSLYNLSQEKGVWKNPILHCILHEEPVGEDEVNTFLALEAPILLEMRIKHLLKASEISQATILAKHCCDHQELRAKGNFKQIYLVCLCSQSPNIKLIEEISKIDCKDALEMICNLESEGDEKTALIICAAFLSRQLQHGEMDCAWELTLFWSKLQQRVDPSVQVYLERCRQLSLLTKTVYHIFFLIKIIQSETEGAGLATCIELCVKALRLESSENANVKISICKTISCLLPDDLEVKRACQLSEFLLEPTVDAYYAVEMLYNQPDQKYDEDSLPVPNSLRCELLLVLKTHWPFDPEFWDWKTLKRQCLALMGEEASIVSSIDELNDSEVYDKLDDSFEESKESSINGIPNSDFSPGVLRDIQDEKRKKRDVKKLRDKGFVSSRFRNFQAYMQYCVLCDKEFLGHRIIRHAQKHLTDGIYSCPICAKKFDSKERLVPHVTLHVKQSSKERLAAMKPLRRLERASNLEVSHENQKSLIKPDQGPVKKNSVYSEDFILFDDSDGSDAENYAKRKLEETDVSPFQKLSNEPDFTCPVCKKGFKHYKNLIAHVRGHKGNEEAVHFLEMQSKKVICHYCRRHFVSVAHLNDHLQMHCGSKPYMCIQLKCRASFDSNTQLLAHRKEHQSFRAKCMFPKCGRIFSESSRLYEHEAQHYHTFTCKFKGCGKVYHSQIQLERHLGSHECKQECASKGERDTTVIYNQTLREPKDSKNVTVKAEPPYNPNSISNANAAAGPLNVKRIKVEQLDAGQMGENCLEHTSVGVCSQVLPSSKELAQMLLPTGGISKVLAPQTTKSEQVLDQSSVDVLEKTDASASSSHVKKSPLSQGICDLLTQGKLAAAVNMIDTGNTLLSQIYTAVKDACNDSSLPIFQESKEAECFNPAQQDLNVSVHSSTSKIELAAQTIERQMGTVVHLGFDNQELYESSFVFPEFEDHVKAAANLLTLPSKTSNGSLFVSSQSNRGNPLVTSSVLKQLPVQKYTCKIEGCCKVYNSIQSIGKHMKATHPQQYPAFTLERKKRKRQRSRNSANSGHSAKVMLDIQPQAGGSNNVLLLQNKNGNSNTSYSNDLQSVHTPVFPTNLENLVNPMLPSMENINRGAQSHKSGTDSFLGTKFEDLSKAALPLKFENDSDPFLPLPAEDCSISNFSSLTLNGTTPVFAQLGNNGNHGLLSQTDAATNSVFPKEEFSGDTDSECNFSESSPTSSEAKKDGHGQSPDETRRRHNSRAKCPAIIRDGKFICRRCFRVFSNPSSLGGHLSKRSYCKPIDDATEFSEGHLQSSGQASLLASMILSSNVQSPQQSTLNTEACFKEPSYLRSLAVENPSSAFLQNLISQASAANVNAHVHEERNEINKHALETVGIAGKLESTGMHSQMTPTNCILGTSTVNAMILPCTSMSPVLDTACNPFTSIDRNKTLNSQSEDHNQPTFSSDLVKNVDKGICSHPVVASQSVPNSCRVSVISGPLSTISNQMDTKEGGSSRKNMTQFLETNLSQNLIASDLLTAMGNLAKNVQENLRKPAENLPRNGISNCEPHLIDTMTNALNNSDKNQICIGNINDHFKQLSDSPALRLQSIKVEKEDSRCKKRQHFEVTVDVLNTNMNSSNISGGHLEVNNIQSANINSGPQNFSVNCATELLSGNGFPKTLAADRTHLPVCAADFRFTNSPALDQMDEEGVFQILERLQRLKLENDLASNGTESDTASASSPPEICSPLSHTSIVASKNASQQVPGSDLSNQLLEEMARPFVCREQTCPYRAMTRDTLFKHYRNVHKYTEDVLKDVKKNQLKFSPFRCVMPNCLKTFTRNSNLRSHCQSVHHFSSDEMEKLRIKRPFEVSLNEGLITPPRSIRPKRESVKIEAESKTELPSLFIESAVKDVDTNQSERIFTEQECRVGDSNLPKHASILQEQHKEALRNKVQYLKGPKIESLWDERDERKPKQRLENDGTFASNSSPYRPYRCVHQDCFAAFTIQQNLILHYQAMHRADLPTFSLQLEEESETYKEDHDETESMIGKEFRCQEFDCSRIFQEVSSLIQHYMKLHEMTPEEIEQVMSATHFGKFRCDQPQCASSFTTSFNYLKHLEVDHQIKIKQGRDDGIYKCDCEGCDRIYATRSNLLRHIYSKHNERHKQHLMRPRRFLQDDEENNSNKANEDKSTRFKPRELQYDVSEREQIGKKNLQSGRNINRNPLSPLKYGKKFLFLKTAHDALAECTDTVPRQYPCMIKGCTSIVASEHTIIRHYTCHKITRAFTLKHRTTLIICKKQTIPCVQAISSDDEVFCNKKSKIKVFDASSVSSDESVASQLSDTERDEVDELAELFEAQLFSKDDGAEHQAIPSSCRNKDLKVSSDSIPEKQGSYNMLKRVHKEKHVSQNKKRKFENPEEEKCAVDRSSVHSGGETTIATEASEEPLPVFDLSSFKPMGFEVSFLKFLEESAVKQKKNVNRGTNSSEKGSAGKTFGRTTSRSSNEETSSEETSEETASEDTVGEDTTSIDVAGQDAAAETSGVKTSSKKTSLVVGHTFPFAVCENIIQFANPSKLQCIGIVQFILDETLKDCTELALKQLQEMKPYVILKKVMYCDDNTVTAV